MAHVNVVRNNFRGEFSRMNRPWHELLRVGQYEEVLGTLRAWPDYRPTPLVSLPGMATDLDLGDVHVKDESDRFGLGSFKALGGAMAVLEELRDVVEHETGRRPSTAELLRGDHAGIAESVTVATCTDGNHGRSVAWGAEMVGCPCKIYMPASVSRGRQDAIEAYGAEVVRTDTNFDECFDRVVADADKYGWAIISDTSTQDYQAVPTLVMQGYRLMAEEALQAMDAPPTHVFLQAGCGGLAAAVTAQLLHRHGGDMPRVITVEPDKAACFYASVLAGRMTSVRGSLETVMGGLSVGTVSVVAWEILSAHQFAAMTLEDRGIIEPMRRVARGAWGDRVVAGESGVVGLAALFHAADDPDTRRLLELDENSRVLAFNTEGRTDPDLYEQLLEDGLPAVT